MTETASSVVKDILLSQPYELRGDSHRAAESVRGRDGIRRCRASKGERTAERISYAWVDVASRRLSGGRVGAQGCFRTSTSASPQTSSGALGGPCGDLGGDDVQAYLPAGQGNHSRGCAATPPLRLPFRPSNNRLTRA